MPHTQFKIYHHAPWRTRSFFLLGVVFFLAFFYAVYEYGKYHGNYVKKEYLAKEERLNKRVQTLFEINQTLIANNASLERSVKIDQQALKQNEKALRKVKKQFQELKKELSFYKNLVTPSDIQRKIQIKSFKIERTSKAGKFSGKLVLAQTKNNKYVRGNVSLVIEGLTEGIVETIKLTDLIKSKNKTLSFKFKYFQNIEMDLVLPENFIPSSVIIEVNPEGGKMRSIEKIYNWAEINS